MLSTLLFVSGFSLALGCAPGSTTGPTYSTATYNFTILPPVSWSWKAGSTTTDQKTTEDAAKAQITADVTDCLTKTLNENNVPTANLTYTINLEAVEANVVGAACTQNVGDYADYKGRLYYKCTAATPEMAESVGSIVFTSGTPITANQWHAIAVNVQDRLTGLKVIFTENVKVKYA